MAWAIMYRTCVLDIIILISSRGVKNKVLWRFSEIGGNFRRAVAVFLRSFFARSAAAQECDSIPGARLELGCCFRLPRCQRETGTVWRGGLLPVCRQSSRPATLPAEIQRGIGWRGASRSAIRLLPLPQTLQASPEYSLHDLSPARGVTKWSRRPAALTGMIGYKADACPAHGRSVKRRRCATLL